MLHLVQVFEPCHAFGPDAQLADGLRPAQQEHGEDGALPGIETERFVEDLAVADDRAAVRGQDVANEFLVLQLVERSSTVVSS